MGGLDRLEKQLVAALRAHLAGAPARPPEAGVLLWQAFIELDMGRTLHMSGPNPIAYTEIEAWARLNRCPLAPHHVRILKAMDATLVEHAATRAKATAPDGTASAPRESKAPLTPKLFDAMMG